MMRALLAFVLVLLLGGAARAERLIVSVSNHRVTVTPNYSGEELVLFGSVEKDATTPPNRTYDLVVTVAGPRADMVTRRKERKFGIWINTDSRQFLKVPTYLALFSNRPFDAAKLDALYGSEATYLARFKAAAEAENSLGAGLAIPAYEQAIKASHIFNTLQARGVISVAERQAYMGRVRDLAKGACEAWMSHKGYAA